MKKGFTLIELLAVIVVLAVIALIAVPRIMDAIDESRAGALRQNNETVTRTTLNYFVENSELLPQEAGETIEVSLSELIENDLINEISSPYSSNNCSGYISITNVDGGHEIVPHINCFVDINSSLEDGLVAHLYENKGFNNSFFNYTTREIDATFHSLATPGYRKNPDSPSFNFNSSSSSYINLGSDEKLNLLDNDELTISLWIKANSPNNASATFVFRGHSGPFSHESVYILGYDHSSPSHIRFRVGPTNLVSESSIDNTKWTHVVATFNGNTNTKTLYIDGEVDNIRNASTSILSSNQDTVIGNRKFDDALSSGFFGQIDDLRIYNRELNSQEAKALYNLTK